MFRITLQRFPGFGAKSIFTMLARSCLSDIYIYTIQWWMSPLRNVLLLEGQLLTGAREKEIEHMLIGIDMKITIFKQYIYMYRERESIFICIDIQMHIFLIYIYIYI